jgi:hypothetical protein
MQVKIASIIKTTKVQPSATAYFALDFAQLQPSRHFTETAQGFA